MGTMSKRPDAGGRKRNGTMGSEDRDAEWIEHCRLSLDEFFGLSEADVEPLDERRRQLCGR